MLRLPRTIRLPPNVMCSSNSPRGNGAFRPGLSLAFGQMTCGVLLESSGESELRFAIWGMKGLIPWGRSRPLLVARTGPAEKPGQILQKIA
jgi:hypothetical protein